MLETRTRNGDAAVPESDGWRFHCENRLLVKACEGRVCFHILQKNQKCQKTVPAEVTDEIDWEKMVGEGLDDGGDPCESRICSSIIYLLCYRVDGRDDYYF